MEQIRSNHRLRRILTLLAFIVASIAITTCRGEYNDLTFADPSAAAVVASFDLDSESTMVKHEIVQPLAALEIETQVDEMYDQQQDQTHHLESLLALQDKYSSSLPVPTAFDELDHAEESHWLDQQHQLSQMEQQQHLDQQHQLPHDALVETHQQQHSESGFGVGVGLSVGASAEVEAAIAAGVDMSTESQMEAQLEALAQTQQTNENAQKASQAEAQTKNLLSFFWGKTPHKVWQDKANWAKAGLKGYVHPHKFEYLKASKKVPHDAKFPADATAPRTRGGRLPLPIKAAAKPPTKTPAFEEFQKNTANGRVRYIHKPGKTIPQPHRIEKAQRLSPPTVGKREVFWLSLGVKRFAYNGMKGASYPFNSVADAKAACAAVGAELATRAQLREAYQSGAEWCACGAVSDGVFGFPMQRRINGCGTGPGTNEVCKAGGATCYGFKPTRESVKKLTGADIAPWKPKQWFQDPFAALNEKCLHPSPWHTKDCLQQAWKIAGCSRRGTRYPATQASTVLWNQLPSWAAVIADMKNIAANDVAGGSTANQCKGPREVFFYSAGPKRFIWNGQSGDGYPYNTRVQAQAACESIGATLATKAQLESAWKDGAEWCMCGALADDDRWSFPMQHVMQGCGSKKGVIAACKAGGATCYGVKPSEKRIAGISPFKPGQYHQDRWTPLVKKCSHEPPYSLSECIRPAWKLASCTKMGKDYPKRGAPILDHWNRMSWDSVREDILNRARNNPESCHSRFAVLDAACNHPPPYSTKRCLQKALKLAGCDKNGFIWPTVANPSTSSQKANLWWNSQKWPVVVADMQQWAQADLVDMKPSHRGGCQGLKETFWYSGTTTASYQFRNAKEAAKACKSIGAELATKAQVDEAYALGADWCAAGYTADGDASYPIQTPRKGCAYSAGVTVWSKAAKGGATCYGFKPNPKDVPGILPFNSKKRFSAVREWRITPLTQCTKQCGGGSQKRRVECVNALNGQVRPEHTCLSLGPKPPTKAACNEAPCDFDWKKSTWTDCTASCGGGVQTRTIRCLQSSTGNEFPHSKCTRGDPKNMPKTQRTCNTQSCISYQWKLAPWEKCSKECGSGKQTRKVMCLGSDGKIHRDHRCTVSGGPKPPTEQQCNLHVCPQYSWKKEPWQACSLSCNGGKTTRAVFCAGSDGSRAPNDSKCLAITTNGPKPRTEKACNTQACLLYTWNPSPWSKCTRSCGGGSKTRTISCIDSFNRTVPDGACVSQGPQPRTVTGCNTIPCQGFNWFPHKWSDCSASCGGGSQTRKVDCVGQDGSLAKDAQCVTAGPKKDTKQACNTKPCVTLLWIRKDDTASMKSLLELDAPSQNLTIDLHGGWSTCSKTCGGGVQTRAFECKASDGSSRDLKACEVVLGPSPTIKQTCNTHPCVTYSFKPSRWSDCSLSCGGGLSTRSVPCVGTDGTVVSKSKCLALKLVEPAKQQPCNTRPCEGFTWQVGPYSSCDASCGGGLQKRHVTCTGSSGKKYDDRHCAQIGQDKPESSRPCNSHRCVEKKWRIGAWDSCDRSCGGGETHRTVACFGTDGKSYSDQDCIDSYRRSNATLTNQQNQKPETKMQCNTQECIAYFWDVAAWDACTNKCGGGLQSRRVVCMSTDGKEQPDALCAALASKPLAQQTCNVAPCPSYKLEIGPWDTCSASCGGGSQNRTVECVSSRGVRITDPTKMGELCPAAPDLEQQCNTQPCLAPEERGWIVKEWSVCDAKCGGGVQQRLVQCASNNDKTCATFGDRPVAERACNTRACTVYEWDTTEWGECSHTCGNNGVQRRIVTCKGTDGSLNNPPEMCKDAGKMPAQTKPCNQNPCISFYWKASDWGTCSKACAPVGGEGGIASREVYCQGSDGARRTDDTCATQGKKPENTKSCNTAQCENYEFKIGEWESCSRGCSTSEETGKQTRSVECRSTTTQKLVDIAKCLVGDAQPPATTRPCNTQPCLTYYWQLGQFGECSNQCDGGYQSRIVTCMGSDGAKYKDDFCLTYSYKAPTQAVCNTRPCGNFSWSPEPVWSSCTVSCDGGIQTRPIRCVGPDGNVWPKEVCANRTLSLGAPPREPTQECNTHPCMTTMWDVTPFSKCTRHCGGGRQVRAVTCRKADGTRIPDRVCARSSPKPSETTTCNTQPCPTYAWVADEFDDCSVSCGGGVQTRDVRCENNFGSHVSNRHCYRLGLERPVPSESCNTKPCGTTSSWQIDPWQPCSAECGGGTRQRTVHCRVGNNATDKHCQSILPMPVTTEQCNTHACITYKYVEGPWSICSTSCDDAATMSLRNSTTSLATQTRTLRCMASDGSFSSLERCAQALGPAALPATTRPCQTNKICPRYRWIYGAWTKCTHSCGDKGAQHRAVYCADDKNRKVKKSLCVFSGPKPYSARRCNMHPCVRKYEWKKLPWGECSKTCGPEGGVMARQAICVDRYGQTVTKQACEITVGPSPRLTKVCNKKPCVSYKWNAKPWSTCSKWCGGGTQSRTITCGGSDGRVHKDLYCTMTNGEKSEVERVCNTVPCVYGHWKKAAKWSECTRTCGGGTRTRAVACVGSDGSVLPDKACERDGPRPPSQSACNKQKCLSTSWFVGTWSACSAKCGTGKQTREVACIASDGVVKADIACSFAGPKASLTQECNTTPCASFVRKYTPFSDCSVSCGGGTQTRTQKCWNTLTNTVAFDQTDCDHIPKEELSRPCNVQPCLTYQWKIAPWSKCSKECGGGEKSRDVTCVGSDGKTVEDKICLQITAKPDMKRSCHSTPCSADQLYGWKVSEFSSCSADCGSGQQTRTVTCTRKSNGAIVPESNCLAKRPPSAHSCNTQPCTVNQPQWKIVNDWSPCDKACGGGEQKRSVVCVNKKGTYLPDSACARSGARPKSHQYCNLFLCNPDALLPPDYNDASESDRAHAAELREQAERELWEKMHPGKTWVPRKKARTAPPPPKHTLYKHRKRRAKAAALAGFKPPVHFVSSSEPSILTDPDALPPPPKQSAIMKNKAALVQNGFDLKAAGATLPVLQDSIKSFDVAILRKGMRAAAESAIKNGDLSPRWDLQTPKGKARTAGHVLGRMQLRRALSKLDPSIASNDYVVSKSADSLIRDAIDSVDESAMKRAMEREADLALKRNDLAAKWDSKDATGQPRTAEQVAARQAIRTMLVKDVAHSNLANSFAGFDLSKDEDQQSMFDLILNIHDMEVRRTLAEAGKRAIEANDLPAQFDKKDSEGRRRSQADIDARQALRDVMVKARARPGMSDEEDMQARYDQFDRYGQPRTQDEIDMRYSIRARQRIPGTPEEELKEIYDLYYPNGTPRPASEIAARKAERLKLAKEAEKKDPLHEMYDEIDPVTGRARTPNQIKRRQLERARRATLTLQRQLAQAKLAQIEADRKAARQQARKDANQPKRNRYSPMTSTGDLPKYNEDGSCSDTRGCVLGPDFDDAHITSDEAIKMLPTVPQFKDPVVDEYES